MKAQTTKPVSGKRDPLYGYARMTRKSYWYHGGPSNPNLLRVTRGKSWAYYFKA